jgi:hypothetical protein
MRAVHRKSWLLAIPVIAFLNTAALTHTKQQTIQGAVINSITGKQIENAYLSIVPGEEEALTNSKGVFSIATWQQLPITLVVEHSSYKKKKISIKDASQYQQIKLEPK